MYFSCTSLLMKVMCVETSVILSWLTEFKQRLIPIYNPKTAANNIFYCYGCKKKNKYPLKKHVSQK